MEWQLDLRLGLRLVNLTDELLDVQRELLKGKRMAKLKESKWGWLSLVQQ